MAGIELERLTKRYPDGTEAVKQMSVEIGDGEFLVLVGPSGCGKSTALRMVAGLESITDGAVAIDGRRVNELAPRDRDIAMVFQSYALYPHMTVRENMGFALKLAKVERAEIRRKVERAAEVLDLGEQLDNKPARLSGGQRQRVAMGRAIVRDPQAFLMDEPLSNLDAKLRVQMRASVATLQRELGTTTIYVTHDQTEAMTLGDRVAVMRGGVVQQIDTPARLYEYPVNSFVAGFLGSPSINFVAARIEGSSIRLPFGRAPLPSKPGRDVREALRSNGAGRDLIAGVRPDHFEDGALANGGVNRLRFRTRVELVESTGSERYVYFAIDDGSDAARVAHLAEDAAGAESGQQRVTARVDAASQAAAGEEIELALDTSRMKLFDPDSGVRLW